MMRMRSLAVLRMPVLRAVAASVAGGLVLGSTACTSTTGTSSAPTKEELGAALVRLDAQKSEFIARCEAFERAWPRYRDALFLSVDGVERPEPMNDRRIAMRDADDIALEYESIERAPQARAALPVTVEERSSLRGADGAVATSAAEARRWVRRFVVHGLASGLDIWVHVPVRDAVGAPIAVEVNGAPLHPESGATMVRVPLARDEATLISMPLR